MAERVVSPGVFTNEIDVSFLPAAVSNIGAALIGICEKGPAFVPTVVDNYTDFTIKFGGLNPDYYLPYTAKSYLKNAGQATIVRVLGSSGYTNTGAAVIYGAGTAGVAATASIAFSSSFSSEYDGNPAPANPDAMGQGQDFRFTGINGQTYIFEPWSGSAFETDGPGKFGIDNPNGNTYFWQISNDPTASVASASAQINAGTATHGITAGTPGGFIAGGEEFITLELSGSVADNLNGGVITTTNTSWYPSTAEINAASGNPNDGGTHYLFDGGKDAIGNTGVAVIFPTASAVNGTGNLTGTTISGVGSIASASSFYLNWQGAATSVSPTMSLNPASANYIENVLGTKPTYNHGHPGYVYKIFKYSAKSLAADSQLSIDTSANTVIPGYSAASTPYICSQTGSDGTGTDLFKFETISDGTSANTEIKIGIANVKKAGSIAGSDFGTFDVVVRKFGDTDKRAEVLESFAGCSLDPDAPNYFIKKIGDYKKSFSNNKVNIEGDYPNMSKYIRVTNVAEGIKAKTLGSSLVPFGFKSYNYPFNGHSSNFSAVTLPVQTNQSSSGEYSSKIYHGVAFDNGSTDIFVGSGQNSDILPWFSPSPVTQTHLTSSAFGLDKDCGVTVDSGIAHKKFVLGFSGGCDGFDETYVTLGATANGQNYGLGKAFVDSTANEDDYKNAINTISNPDEIDINMVVLPGINANDHSAIHAKARETVEDRADCFYIFDADNYNGTNSTVIAKVETEDSNYSSTYWPWVKIYDDENNKHVWAPPSVVVPGVVAFTDKVAHPWFAPAGLNRGGLTEAVMAKDRLTHSERDDLYDGRVNPIATFPGEGVVVWGQKTLQSKPSALDRVNVRRLLIALKKFIASASRYLVFEQNTNATRQKFLNIVNPYMEQVQSNSGLSAFRVVMDDSNNTPDVVDRNELKGQIFIQPTRTAEFIVLDFIVQPTGATFPE